HLTGANYRSQKEKPTSAMNTPKHSNHAAPSSAIPELAGRSFDLIQQQLAALQKLSEQTAQLHRQFLEGQDRALAVFQSLLQQQQSLLGFSANGAVPHQNGTLEIARPQLPEIPRQANPIRPPEPRTQPRPVAMPRNVVPAPTSPPAPSVDVAAMLLQV